MVLQLVVIVILFCAALLVGMFMYFTDAACKHCYMNKERDERYGRSGRNKS